MNHDQPIPDRLINGVQFYCYPYMDISIGVNPPVINDLFAGWSVLVRDTATAALFLQHLIDRGRSIGIQLYVYIENVESSLPEVHRLTTALLSVQEDDHIFVTPPTASTYSFKKLQRLFGNRF